MQVLESTNLRVIVHREIPDDPKLRREWNALVAQTESPQVFYTYEWARAVAHAFGDQTAPWLLLTYNGERLSGVAALSAVPGNTTAQFLCGTTADYCDFVSRPPDREMLVESVLSELRRDGIENIVLANLPADSPTVRVLANARTKYGFHIFQRTGYRCAQVTLGGREQRAKLKEELDKKKMFRRNINFLRREGAVGLKHWRAENQVREALPEFCEAHVARFLLTGRISNLVRSSRRAFLTELARGLSKIDALTLTCLTLGDKAIAWNYGFQFQGSWFWYQPTFDSRLEEHSPGYLMLSKIVMEACDDQKMTTVDLGLGAEGYKERFANASRETLYITLSSNILQHTRAAGRYRAAAAIKSVPRAETFARGLISRTTGVRRRFHEHGLPNFVRWSATRVAGLIASREQVDFFEWTEDRPEAYQSPESLTLKPVNLRTLARAAMNNEREEGTLVYALRSAKRLRTPDSDAAGFYLADDADAPLHFCWVTRFDGFFMEELGIRLEDPAKDLAMIFDCWTPVATRGHGYYGAAIRLLAQRVLREGGQPWIFSAATNQSSIRGIEKSGFVKRYSMIRSRTLGWQNVKRIHSRAAQKSAIFAAQSHMLI